MNNVNSLAPPPPDSALRVLQLLLRCGMIGREELTIVLDMIGPFPSRQRPAEAEAAADDLLFEFD